MSKLLVSVLSVNLVNPDMLLLGGVIGLGFGIIFFLFFVYHRIRWIFTLFVRQKRTSFKLFASLRNLILISLWTSVFGMVLFLGFFLRAYYVFTLEQPVAKIQIESSDQDDGCSLIFTRFVDADSQIVRTFRIKGDQWMLEGDIIKWDNWLNFLGIHTRYRLTRLRGRYLKMEDEIEKRPSVFSLIDEQSIPFWTYLYDYGRYFPFVSTVYGNAAFQSAKENKSFLVFVSTSGFVVREQEKE